MKLVPIVITIFAVMVIGAAPASQPTTQKGPPGKRIALTDGQFFLPESINLDGTEPLDLVIHLHGAAWAAEKNLVASKLHAAGVTVVLSGLSKVYTDKFTDAKVFPRIIEEATTAMNGRKPRRIILTSFSAGFGGVREILKSEDNIDRIDVLILADSLHTGLTDQTTRAIDPKPLEPFLAFAKLAATGDKQMILSHSQIKPPNYAGTTETNEYLIREVAAETQSTPESWENNLQLLTTSTKGKFLVFGFSGETGPDHMKHLHTLWRLLERVEPAK